MKRIFWVCPLGLSHFCSSISGACYIPLSLFTTMLLWGGFKQRLMRSITKRTTAPSFFPQQYHSARQKENLRRARLKLEAYTSRGICLHSMQRANFLSFAKAQQHLKKETLFVFQNSGQREGFSAMSGACFRAKRGKDFLKNKPKFLKWLLKDPDFLKFHKSSNKFLMENCPFLETPKATDLKTNLHLYLINVPEKCLGLKQICPAVRI